LVAIRDDDDEPDGDDEKKNKIGDDALKMCARDSSS
jgi:hypothetical protein